VAASFNKQKTLNSGVVMTKKFLLASIGLGLALASVAPAAAGSWTGIYLGGHAGGAWGDVDTTKTDEVSLGFDFNSQSIGDEHNLSPNGVLGGVQVGYLYQMSNLVFGIEVSGSMSDFDQSGIDPNDNDNVRTVNSDWNAAATLRAGYAFGNSMAYVKGGYAMAEIEDGVVDTNPVSGSYSTSERQDGWTAGGGFEHQLSNDVSLALEYNYYDLGAQDHVAVQGPDAETHEVELTMQTVTARLNWHFNP
jgi:outer membrane immunogenic protein